MKKLLSRRAVIARIRRLLAKEGNILTANPFVRGGFYITDGKNIIRESTSVRMLAQDLGVLEPWESIQ